MNELEISHILKTNFVTASKFIGVFAADELDISILSFPAFLIANTGIRRKGGFHWVCIFFPILGECEYFDSLGGEAKRQFLPLILKYSSTYVCMTNRIQDINTNSCGLFCLDFAFARCGGVSFDTYSCKFDTRDLKHNEVLVYYKWCVSRNYTASVC